ncbi:FA13C protein, partial [Atractosteus spatula]|nr:FA13C protein [Atractosteus spatula]
MCYQLLKGGTLLNNENVHYDLNNFKIAASFLVRPRLPLHFAVCSNSLTFIGIVLMNCEAEEWSEKQASFMAILGFLNVFIYFHSSFSEAKNIWSFDFTVQKHGTKYLLCVLYEFLSKSRSHSDETQSALKQKSLYLKFRDVSMFLTNVFCLNELMKGGLMGGIQLQPAAKAIFFPASEGKTSCSKSTDQGSTLLTPRSRASVFFLRHYVLLLEDSAQIQGNKEQSLPTARSVQAEESSNPGEPVPALRILHHERESSAESQQAPGPSRLLHHITDGDSPLPSPRCPSFSQSQRFNSDPESAPSPPSAQQFIMSRGIVRTVPSEGSKEPLSVALLTKHIQNLKKKIKKFEERFEQERKYRPSHNDKTANPEMFKLMDDLAKSRKQLKDLKLKQSVVELRERRTDSQTETSRVSSDPQGAAEQQHKPCLEETVDTLLKRLKEKRSTLGLPENMKEMNQNQMALEKVTLQKCLLYFESLHGRPVTKQERNLMKPLYDRYRAIKQLLCSTPSITTIVRLHFYLLWQQIGDNHCHLHNLFKHIHISPFNIVREEEDSDDDNMPHSPAPPSRALCQISTDESLCPQDEDNETAFVSPLDEVKAVRQPAITMSNLHEASKPELLEYLRETRAEKHRLRRALREFEDQFFKQMGRAAQKEDRIPMAEEYYEYKNIKAKLRLLEVLLSKQEASKTI